MTARYTLAVSFELGTDPDIDTVNVNNRVQTAIAQLPQEVQLQGIKVQKKSSSILQFVNLYDESGKYDPLFITNFAIINVLDELSRTPGVGRGQTVRRARLLDADLVRHGALDKPQSCAHPTSSKPSKARMSRPRSAASAHVRLPTISSSR